MKTVPAFYISALGAPLITAGVLYLLYMRRTALGYTLNKFAFLASVASIAVWTFWLILAGLIKNKRIATAVGLLLLAAELLITNQAAVYDRAYLTKTDYKADYFNDGTQDAVAKIKESDSGLYRINTSTEYDFANEGLVDGFNATTTYSNTNPASIVSLSRAFGTISSRATSLSQAMNSIICTPCSQESISSAIFRTMRPTPLSRPVLRRRTGRRRT